MMRKRWDVGLLVGLVIPPLLWWSAFAMPPRPGLGISDPTHTIAGMESPVLREVRLAMTAEGRAVLRLSSPVQGMNYYPVLLIDYADLSAAHPRESFQREIFDGPHSTGTVQDYFHEASRDTFTVDGDVYGWYGAPNDRAYYSSNGNWGLGIDSYPNNAAGLVVAALERADPEVDFSLYDNDSDNEVDALVVIHAGEGAEGSASGYDIWSHNWDLSSWTGVSAYTTDDGVVVDTYIICPEISSIVAGGLIEIGVICHELGHTFGLPDLYDTTPYTWPDSDGIGNYGLMSFGSWGGDGNSPQYPVHLCAWSKKFLGWVDPISITGSLGNISLDPVETGGEVYMIGASNPIDTTEYFLLENRQQIGFDQSYPAGSHGLLIWHIDEEVIAAGLPSNTVNGDVNHKGVDLEEADGLNHLDVGSDWNRGDAGDFYPGSTVNRVFDAQSNPNSDSYDGSETEVGVRNISEAENLITCTVTLGSDSYEPNDDFPEAYGPINPPGEAYISYIVHEEDVDYFWFNVAAGDTIEAILDVPPAIDYDLELYSGTSLAAASSNGAGMDETISHVALSGGIFYVRVVGVDGSWSAVEPYSLTVDFEDITPPSLGVALLHNTYLTRYLDVWVVSDEPLESGPTARVILGSSQTVLDMDELMLQTYQGDYRFSETGTAFIEVTAADSSGNDTTRTRSLTIALSPPLSGQTLTSTDGRWRLELPSGAVAPGEYLTVILEEEEAAARCGPGGLAGPGDRTVVGRPARFGPEGMTLGDEAVLEVEFEGLVRGDASPQYLGVYRLDGEDWRYLGGVLDPGAEVVRVEVDRLGVYALMLDLSGPPIPLTPQRPLLAQNYPNPFTGATTIDYLVPACEGSGEEVLDVRLAVYNLLGQRVATLLDRPEVPGEYRQMWEGRDDRGRQVASGIYYYRLDVGRRSVTKKLVYLR
jgi:M6 family metalloprotease-like protein